MKFNKIDHWIFERMFDYINKIYNGSCLTKLRRTKSQRQTCPLSPAVASNVESGENLQTLTASPPTWTMVWIFDPVWKYMIFISNIILIIW